MGLFGTLGKVVGLDDLISEIGATVRQVLPNAQAKRDFDLQLAALHDKYAERIHEEMLAQVDVNKTEAQHASIFVAGWRPAVGWVCVIGLGWNFLFAPLLITFGASPGMAPIEHLVALLTGLLGLSGLRTFEIKTGINRDSLKWPRKTQPAADVPAEEEENAPWNRN